ncbi:GNAT family acetyltransferase [Staphylococcus microti]|uniref:GNAT family acetyltransferase n=1 Tax=Staphylococcus microti TaxID=569857 RepID=A0A0D6XRN4_9STAP|nr:GNAT family N-acetyltransferase [Staphylococcus microti]KIX90483.1 GNAT family acetyltransferase [Staphylococcus microti]PNZ83388.1 N-acetyltransferase [Staphylococcus microti]SUM57944.1 GNAT family acetyltransferase [Staphylococcus microti]
MTYDIKETDNKFYIGEDVNAPQAEITFIYRDDHTIDVNHTYVSPELRGGGVAKQLFNRVIEKAQREQLKIIPTCSYVKLQFDRDASLASLKA